VNARSVTPSGGDPLARFHRVLVAALLERGDAALRAPFTVAEIYQDLVPYRTHRDRLGVDMNGDYEQLLLRLLAGEGELVRLESEPALREIRKELKGKNPNTGVYREYAAVDVRLVEERIPADLEAGEPDPVTAREGTGAPESALGGLAAERPPAAAPRAAAVEGDAHEGTCRWCGEGLPPRDNLRYCPHCGADVRVVPCPSCGEALESGWRFCIACGQEVGSG
jgi:hypothetical protein